MLFISHLHEDKPIADTLREFVVGWTGGRVEVFQSSSAEAERPRIGRRLSDELMTQLKNANVVTLLHTQPDGDLSTCLWEVGVATGAKPDTNVVLLECGESVPAVFDDRVRVNIRGFADIQGFVQELLTRPAFFPPFTGAVTDFEPRSPDMLRAAQDLNKRLQSAQPPPVEEPERSWCSYPCMTLQLSFSHQEIISQATDSDRLSKTVELLENQVLVLGSDSDAGRVYGIADAPKGMLLKRLIAAWKGNTPTPRSKWVEGLACQVMDTSLNRFPTLRWELFRGADKNDGTWYGPAVVRVRRIPARRVLEFDVLLCKFSVDETGAALIGVPPIGETTD